MGEVDNSLPRASPQIFLTSLWFPGQSLLLNPIPGSKIVYFSIYRLGRALGPDLGSCMRPRYGSR